MDAACEMSKGWYFRSKILKLIYMSHFSYACKTEGENGISHLISALCINCMSAVLEYSRIFVTVLRDGEINNIIILPTFKHDDSFP